MVFYSQGFRMTLAVCCAAQSSKASWMWLIGRTWLMSRSIKGDCRMTVMIFGKSDRL